MKFSVVTIASLFALGCTTASAAEDANSIAEETVPVKSILGYRIPGTEHISEAIPVSHRKLIEDIRERLTEVPKRGSKAGPAFVVSGDAVAAIVGAKATLVDERKPASAFRPDQNLWIVFFVRLSPRYVLIEGVAKTEKGFRLEYQLIQHEEKELTTHLALVPIGKLPVGKYQIHIQKAPDDRNLPPGFGPLANDVVQSFICQSSEFEVTENGEPE